MKNEIKTIAFRCNYDTITNLQLCIDQISYDIPCIMASISGQYNVRCVFEKVINQLTYDDFILGELINQTSLEQLCIDKKSNIQLVSKKTGLPEFKIPFSLQGKFHVGIKIFKDTPTHTFPSMDVLPIPTEVITIYIYFSETEIKKKPKSYIFEKYFDSYNNLGFFLVDLAKMKEIITKKYGNKELDLVYEFSNTEIIDELFNHEIIMIIWGIHPYIYPVYSSDNIDLIHPLLGRKFKQEGIFNIDENINELSLIPGYELRNWPNFTKKVWPKISLRGKGKIAHLTPYILEDSDLNPVLISFLIHRSEGVLTESIPLLNVNLLYN